MIKKTIKDHKRIIFNGNGYDDNWIKEATEKRGLLNYCTTADCMPHLMDKKNVDMLISHKVFTERELESRMEIMLDNYCKTVIIEANTMVVMAKCSIAPAVEKFTASLAKNQSVDNADSVQTVSFAGQLHAALDRISDTQNTARTQAEKFTLGEPGVALNDVMTDLQKSSISLQMGVQVRNKLVTAYQDIMNMQV